MPRTRSFLFDGSLGRAFYNVSSVSAANSSNLVAGTVSKLLTLRSASTVYTANNLGAGVSTGTTGGLITSVKLTLTEGITTSISGVYLRVRLRSGTSYSSSSTITNVDIFPGTVLLDVPLNLPATPGMYLYADVSYSKTPIRYPRGLTIAFTFFPSPA